jgi:GTPase SAR1 family protein
MIKSLAWSLDGSILASGSSDQTIRLWNPDTGHQIGILEGHTSGITCVSFSYDGRLLASKSYDGTVRIWRTDTWETVATLKEPSSGYWMPGLAFHPSASTLATLSEQDTAIRIWDLDVDALLKLTPTISSVHYTNAKVVLVGDSGVGKSGLSLVLSKQPFVPTESTHGRKVWNFDSQEIKLDGGRKETRETLLWDLAGQPGYRLIHQLHLSEISVALIVFDSHSETDPFAGVSHWVRALQIAQRVQGDSAPYMKKFLVAARIDRGGKDVSRQRVDELIQELELDGYFETSAKEGLSIASLIETIKHAIQWKTLPKVTSTDLFQRIKTFLIAEKEAGRLLSTREDLYRSFLKSDAKLDPTKDLYAQFETCIGRVESQGLIRRLSFGSLVLLQPELLDVYASALIHAVKDEPDGLGCVSEADVQAGNFSIPKDERLTDREQEKLLLIAMVEDMLRYEIALREHGDDEPYLVFPSQSTRENPSLPDPEGKSVIFRFEGSILNVYATLAVRLSRSGLFIKKEHWKNAATYTTKLGGVYGMLLHNRGEGYAELTLFFGEGAKEDLCFHFEEYVKTHLERRALPETIQRRRIFVCPGCTIPLDDLHVTERRKRGFNWIRCSVCEETISILDGEERLAKPQTSLILQMDRTADTHRRRAVASSILQGRSEIGDFDVFLCHNGKNKAEIKVIGEALKERGILPWLDEWELQPGLPWQSLLEKQIGQIKSAAVFVGRDGVGPWQRQELDALLREFVKRNCPVIPVLLANVVKEPELPVFLRSMTWVDFRKRDPDPMDHLVWGITGKRSFIQ